VEGELTALAGATVVQRVAVTEVEYASWPRRLAAFLIDAVLLWVAVSVMWTATVAAASDEALTALVYVPLLTFPAYYTVAQGGRSGRTLGKASLGIAVRDARTYGPLGHGRAFGRWLVTLAFWALFTAPGVLDALSPLWHDRRRAWHDLAAGSIVIRI
jgi:uncharacterized RDD family membrane protein YckC